MEGSREMISEAPAHSNNIQETLRVLLENLKVEAKNIYDECLRILKGLISNIISHPEEDRYRRIRKNNPKFYTSVGRFENAVIFLSMIGFELIKEEKEGELDEVLYLIEYDPDTFNQAVQLMNKISNTALKKKQNQRSGANDGSISAQMASAIEERKQKYEANRQQERHANPNFQPETSAPPDSDFGKLEPVTYKNENTIARPNNQSTENGRPPLRSISDFHRIENIGYRAFELTNEYRNSRGLRPLIWDQGIATVAEVHSRNMGEYRVPFSHEGFNERAGEMPHFLRSKTAENVAMSKNLADPGKAAVDGWIQSPGHRKNLEGNFRYMGIGVYRNNEGGIYFTQMFVLAP